MRVVIGLIRCLGMVGEYLVSNAMSTTRLGDGMG